MATKEKKILMIVAAYPPEPIVTANISRDVAIKINKDEFSVEVWCPFPNRPEGKIHESYKKKAFLSSESRDGVRVKRFRAFVSKRSTLLSRGLENLSFGIISTVFLLLNRRVDCVYLNTWPIISTGMLSSVLKLRGIPYIVHVQDLYPEGLVVQNNRIKNSVLWKFSQSVDNFVCRYAAHCIFLSERMLSLVRARTKTFDTPSTIVPNWGTLSLDHDRGQEGDSLRLSLNIPSGDFVMLYAGNVSRASGILSMVQMFALLPSMKNFHFLIAGSGSELDACREVVERNKLSFVKFHSPWLPSEQAIILHCADAFLLPTVKGQSIVSVPSKLISYLLAARPILAICEEQSQLADVIDESGSGIRCDPGDNYGIYTAIIKMQCLSANFRVAMGQSGRRYAIKKFGSNRNSKIIVNLLKSIVDGGVNFQA